MNPASRWLILVYTIPRQPSALRVGIWRKLNQLGARLLHDAAWVLPRTAAALEQFRWLCGEIQELGGAAQLWFADSAMPGGDDEWQAHFQSDVEKEYRSILLKARHPKADFARLARRFQQAQRQDYFGSPLANKTRMALLRAKGVHQR